MAQINHRLDGADLIEALRARIRALEGARALGAVATVCTSTTRPANPVPGRLIYETDTTKLGVWTGSAWLRVTVT